MADTLGMHLKQTGELQIADREFESADRHYHSAKTVYEPGHFVHRAYEEPVPHIDSHGEDAFHHRQESHNFDTLEMLDAHGIHGLPVHDRYGRRTIDQDPY